jgi:hypothetical protein
MKALTLLQALRMLSSVATQLIALHAWGLLCNAHACHLHAFLETAVQCTRLSFVYVQVAGDACTLSCAHTQLCFNTPCVSCPARAVIVKTNNEPTHNHT